MSFYNSREQVIRERNLEPEKYPYMCQLCSFRSQREVGVIIHMRKRHPSEIYIKPLKKQQEKWIENYDEETLEWLDEKSDQNMLKYYSSRKKLTAREHKKLKRIHARVKMRERLKNG